MTNFTVLRAEREFDKKRNGEERLVQSCVDVLVNSGFQVAVSHVEKGVGMNGKTLKEILLGDKPLFPKRIYTDRLLGKKLQEAAGEPVSQASS